MPLCLVQAWLLALLAAQKDDRLALLHLGHMHHQGLHGLPADPDLAYAYYANIAKQTTLDHQHPTPEQVIYTLITGCWLLWKANNLQYVKRCIITVLKCDPCFILDYFLIVLGKMGTNRNQIH